MVGVGSLSKYGVAHYNWNYCTPSKYHYACGVLHVVRSRIFAYLWVTVIINQAHVGYSYYLGSVLYIIRIIIRIIHNTRTYHLVLFIPASDRLPNSAQSSKFRFDQPVWLPTQLILSAGTWTSRAIFHLTSPHLITSSEWVSEIYITTKGHSG